MAENQTFEDDVMKLHPGSQIWPATCTCTDTELRMIYLFYKCEQKNNALCLLKTQNQISVPMTDASWYMMIFIYWDAVYGSVCTSLAKLGR